jgi:LmbE family N-acetylglucosaminyl deacetylase
MNQNILVVAAHADDEVLGCGATMASHASRGDRVVLLILADGVTSRVYDVDLTRTREEEIIFCAQEIERRKEEARKAARILGLKDRDIAFMDLADQRLDQYPLLYLVKCIERFKADLNPDVIYTHFWDDLNLDHQLACRAVLTAFRPKPQQQNPTVFHFEVPESTLLSVPNREKAFRANHYVDVAKTFDLKLKALEAYESEKRAYPDYRSSEYITQLAQKRGKEAGMAMAEAFVRL